MSNDTVGLVETASVTVEPALSKSDAINAARQHGVQVWEGRARIEKFHGDDTSAAPYEVIESDPNLLTTGGATIVWNLVTGAGGTALNSTNARLCVGDSATAATAGDTDLVAATNKFRKVVSGAPTVTGNQAVFTATFATGEANFAWNEAGVANAATGQILNRFVQSFGTKTSAATWTLTVTLTLS